MLASDVITAATDLLNDTDQVTWPAPSLLRWIGEGQRQITQFLPRAYQVRQTLVLVANDTVQTLPADCLRLVRMLRNLGVSGSTPGRRITVIDEDALSRQERDWHAAPAADAISHFMVDDETPRLYMVWPRPNTALRVDAIVSKAPPAPNAPTDTLALGDEYLTPLANFVLYRAWSKNHTRGDLSKADRYYAMFERALGIREAADLKQSPDRKAE